MKVPAVLGRSGRGAVSKAPEGSRSTGRLAGLAVVMVSVALVATACGSGSSSPATTAAPVTTTSPISASSAPPSTAANASVPTCPSGVGQGSPGVTANSINVASLSTQTGALAGDFGAMLPGVEAYFKYIDSMGGVNGRMLNLSYKLDDESNPSQYSQLVHTAIDQDHAFGLVGVATAFFSPNYLAQTCTPTYGYNVTGNWSGPPNLYSTGGTALYYPEIAYYIAYLMKRINVRSFATLAYGVAASSDACAAANSGLTKAGLTQAYTDLSVPLGGNVTPDVQQIKSSGAQLVISCMDVTDNVSLARGIQQYGVKTKQFWLNGSDQSTLDHYGSLMQGVYFGIQHVPLTAPVKYYPGLQTYLTAMRKYAPASVGDELAIQGWASAALFVQGVKNAGSNLTQANVVKQDNMLTTWTANGLYLPIDWTTSHTTATTFCSAYIQVQGNKYNPVLGQGHQVFVCFNINKANPVPTNPVPEISPPGTPGA
jgi:branched-chain amino acid transport system substrate-binding protein